MTTQPASARETPGKEKNPKGGERHLPPLEGEKER